MFRVRKRMEISAMHHLNLDYESPCTNNHGHNWVVIVEIAGHDLNKNGMLLDFKTIKELIHQRMDHGDLNQVFDFNPTAENIAVWIKDTVNDYLHKNEEQYGHGVVPYCSKVTVMESENNFAEWSV